MKKRHWLSVLSLSLLSFSGYVFYVSASWDGCIPIGDVDEYLHLLGEGERVPKDATCFATNHLTSLSFYEYPDKEENVLAFFGLRLSLVPLLLAFVLSANKAYELYLVRNK